MPSPGQKPIDDIKREKFALEYSRHGKGERAVIAAGYNVKSWSEKSTSACVTANRLLKDDKVRQRIQWLQENRARKADFTELKLLRELKRVALFDIRKIYTETGDLKPVTEWDADTAAAVRAVEVEKLFGDSGSGRKGHIGYTIKVKTADKIAAIDKLMKYFGMLDTPADPASVTNIENQQVNFYLPENPRHVKKLNHADESVTAEVVDTQPEPEAGAIQLPAKRNG
jgi:phage terminase small subunit